ncbi:gliding motility-associated C-terminal domain-containing protein [Mucilaginibacter sp.]|uniref:gliding motility-associated C-terminal domain-containing protein n=1 Tax=Mucilaginibacter sp. TaxID=1882438 RepID=UPI003B0045CE
MAILSGYAAMAQTCTGSLGEPAFKETFGAGKTYGLGTAFQNGETNLQYAAADCGGDDETYTITTSLGSACKGATWQNIAHDHTGDEFGYFMLVNASYLPSVFYTKKVDGSKLCPNTTYFFGAYIMNILRDLPKTQNYAKPNITFRIESVSGNLLGSYNTGDIPAIKENDPVVFTQYGGFFKSTTSGEDLIIKMINNAPGGAGNDFAMDDITFSPCGELIQTGFGVVTDNTSRSACVHDNLNYNLVSKQTGYNDPDYQWQQNFNDGHGWVNIPGAKSPTLPVSLNNVAAGAHEYRVGIINQAQIGSESCRIYSYPLIVNVYAPPAVTVSPKTNTCIGQPLYLSSTGGDSYLWTGPNNFTSTESSPVVTSHADIIDNGTYQVTVFNHGCATTQQTQVSVFPAPSVAPLNDLTICEGNAVQLNGIGTNVTHYKWLPATGLSNANIANPIASPAATTTYQLSVNNDGCPEVAPTASLTVTVLKKPVADAGKPVKIFEGESVRLQGKITGTSSNTFWGPASYLDNPNSLMPLATPPGDITYTLHAAAAMGCGESTSTVFIRVFKKLIIPNSFSPNNDGVNDLWNIANIDSYPLAEVNIYNRYGNLVFHSIGYPKGWNGTYNYKPLSVGTYYYVIDLKEDNLPKKAGWLLLVR